MGRDVVARACCCKLKDRVTALEEDVGGIGTSNVIFLPTVTGYIGGGATKLDGVTTVGVPVNTLYAFKHSTDGGLFYILVAGTDAEASPSVIRPDDYNGTTNAKVFKAFV